MNTFHQHHQQHNLQPHHCMANGTNNVINTVVSNGISHINATNNVSTPQNNVNQMRQTHLTKFAILLSSARGEGSDEPVVGMHHDVEMEACFSKRHLCAQQHQLHHGHGAVGSDGTSASSNNGMMMMQNNMMIPPSIRCSSLSMKSKGSGVPQMNNSGCKKSLLETAAMNMRAPFYTTPDTVSSTAKTVLRNIVSTMEELMDSRLRSTVSQLVKKSGGIANSQLLFRLLSPSRNPIQVAIVITRFVLPGNGNDENIMGNNSQSSQSSPLKNASISNGEMLSIPLKFKAILDVKVFGEVSTVELTAPVTMLGKFDPQDGLLTAVDVSFDCVNLLQTMITQARLVVKTVVTKAAALSVQIAEWHANKKAQSLAGVATRGGGVNNANGNVQMNAASSSLSSTISLHSLLGSSISLNSLGSLSGNSSFFGAFPSMNSSINKAPASKHGVPRKSLLRVSSRGLGLRNNNMANGNANATFDFGNGNNNQSNNVNGSFGHRTASSASVVRFQMPNALSPTTPSPKRISCSSPETSYSSNTQQQQQVQAPVPKQEQQEDTPQQNKGNIHTGLFSWLQNDSMFLTDEKIEEQNAADAERERLRQEAPMPLRFFTAAESMGGGECGLEMVSKSIFGGQQQAQQQHQQHGNFDNGNNCQVKREHPQQQDGNGQHDPKRRKVWH